MSIINNSHAIGVDSRNLVLKTRGTLHVKVGDRYYELDFRNMLSNSNEEKEVEKEQYILTIDDKSFINSLEYPGDNKFIIGKNDSSFFVTVGGEYIDLSPKTIVLEPTVNKEPEVEEQQITELQDVTVHGSLSGLDGMEINFGNNSISANNLTIYKSVSLPRSTVTTWCGKVSPLNTNYKNYDFLELSNKVDQLHLKDGVMIKSFITADILVKIEDLESTISFVNEGVYMIYILNNLINYTKL